MFAILQIVWLGAKYAVTDSLEVTAAYYHQAQNDYTAQDCTLARAHAQRAGTMDTASALIDWKFAPKWETYIGTQYTQSNGGFNSGYLSSKLGDHGGYSLPLVAPAHQSGGVTPPHIDHPTYDLWL